MTLDERMQKIENAFGAQSELVRELRDAVNVTAHLEARQGRVLKEHGEWLEQHDAAMREHAAAMKAHDDRMKAHDERMKDLDERIAGLVSGFGEFLRRAGK